jgi:hypothetical protein
VSQQNVSLILLFFFLLTVFFYDSGPGVPKGVISEDVNTHTDIAPTFLKIAGAETPKIELDGTPIPIHGEVPSNNLDIKEAFGVEFWRPIVPEYYNIPFEEENTYRSVRIVGEGYSFLYTVWCTGEAFKLSFL